MKKDCSIKVAALVAATLFVTACGGENASPEKTTTPDIQQPVDLKPKREVSVASTFTFQYSLSKNAQIRVVEPALLGKVSIDNRLLTYTAPKNKTGSDRFKLEIIEQAKVKTVRWLIRVNAMEPRFHQIPLGQAEAAQHWQCVSDNKTHRGITWVVPLHPNNETFAWQDWEATLPNLSAQCSVSDGPCNTDALIQQANSQSWCGKSDWRLPYAYEMRNITSEQDFALDRNRPAIDPYFFGSVGFEQYWLATDASAKNAENFAYRHSFGTERKKMSLANKRNPTSVMLVSGAFRDPTKPDQQDKPQDEATSFIRLNNKGRPLASAKQQDSFSNSPWRCLDDMRSLVRDTLYLRDGRFSYLYWLTPNGSDITSTSNLYQRDPLAAECGQQQCSLDAVIAQINSGKQCGRSNWRLPTADELALLMYQEVNGGAYRLLYQVSLNNPESGDYWVKTKDSQQVGILSLPRTESLEPVTDIDASAKARLLLIATEFEPLATEDPRSIGQHGKPDFRRLRRDYATHPDKWPEPFIDDPDNYQELGILPAVQFPAENPYSANKAALGKRLFFDTFLSRNNDVSCSSCHDPQKGWTDHLEVSIGHDRQRGKRNAPTVVNSGFLPTLFWDGRADTLEQQSLMPIQDPLEMAEDLSSLVARLNGHAEYPAMFEKAFQQTPITEDQLGQALATFQRTLVSNGSQFDKFVKEAPLGKTDALSDQALWGLDIYRRNGRCVNCHMGPEFTNHQFENVGLTYYKAFYEDLGRYNIDGESTSVGKFKTPSLRDVMNTGPWFHNGLVPTMDGVVSMYSEGMASNAPFGWDKYDPNYPVLSEKIRPLNLTVQESEALKAFLKAITANSPEAS
ncbi:cytochrome c peroxidase [Veronia pacifica]|uniref:Methylamine utilization protein MauG n=1 Tax=Veronia pacifica TaxID=1080227 RepID=A0A1C3ER64_9GAMM|nr:cytochrome c peroxidase [Veronia pacifica]ODA35722.1 cytochrome-c peroxidase [Veronia pacifica]